MRADEPLQSPRGRSALRGLLPEGGLTLGAHGLATKPRCSTGGCCARPEPEPAWAEATSLLGDSGLLLRLCLMLAMRLSAH